MTGCSLLHELGKYSCMISICPFLCHHFKKFMPDRAILPVWFYLFLLYIISIFVDFKADLISFVHYVKIFFCMAAKFGKCRSTCRIISFLPYYKFTFIYTDRFLVKYFFKGQSPKYRNGIFILVFLVEISNDLSPSYPYMRNSFKTLLS